MPCNRHSARHGLPGQTFASKRNPSRCEVSEARLARRPFEAKGPLNLKVDIGILVHPCAVSCPRDGVPCWPPFSKLLKARGVHVCVVFVCYYRGPSSLTLVNAHVLLVQTPQHSRIQIIYPSPMHARSCCVHHLCRAQPKAQVPASILQSYSTPIHPCTDTPDETDDVDHHCPLRAYTCSSPPTISLPASPFVLRYPTALLLLPLIAVSGRSHLSSETQLNCLDCLGIR